MGKKGCSCDEKFSQLTCRICSSGTPLLYWCEICQQLVPEKRCSSCGLKTRKVRQPGQK